MKNIDAASTYKSEVFFLRVLASVSLPLLADCARRVLALILEAAVCLSVDDRHFVAFVIYYCEQSLWSKKGF